MRQDSLTTKLQEALSDARSLALGNDNDNDNDNDNAVHLLAAMLRQDEGPRALLERAGVNAPGLTQATEAAIEKLPQVQVQGGEAMQVGQELGKKSARGRRSSQLDMLRRANARRPPNL